MLAGTLARYVTALDEPLEDTFSDSGIPALSVEKTQDSFDDRPIQAGSAADRTKTTVSEVTAGVNEDGEYVALDVDRFEDITTVYTEWVADPTHSGLIAAESVDGGESDEYPFPFDMFYAIGGEQVERLYPDVTALHDEWTGDGLSDVWMVGQEDGDGTTIDYHDAADMADRPTLGVGFVMPWESTVMRGVVYASGYIAVYNTNHESRFMRFIADEIEPFCETDSDSRQATL